MNLNEMINKYYGEYLAQISKNEEDMNNKSKSEEDAYVAQIKSKIDPLIPQSIQDELGLKFSINSGLNVVATFEYFGALLEILLIEYTGYYQIVCSCMDFRVDSLPENLLRDLMIILGKIKGSVEQFKVCVVLDVEVLAPTLKAAVNVATTQLEKLGYSVDYDETHEYN